MKKWIKLTIIFLIIICLIILPILIIKYLKTGHNISNKSIEEIEEYILNINGYEAEVKIVVNSNKNTNTYIANQKYSRENSVYKQEILEPENIKGMVFSYDGTNLKIENTKLNLSKIYENYNCIGSNDLNLVQFVADYTNSDDKSINEKDETIIMKTEIKNGNKYRMAKKLYIDKSNLMPLKLEIQDLTR